MFKEFKEFAIRGNVVDLAVGFIMGAAFKSIVDALTEGVLNPIIGLVTAGIDISDLAVDIGGISLQYGLFIDAIIKFIIIAFFMFLLVKSINRLKRKDEEDTPTEKSCPFCKTSIPLEATRCPHCTSALETETIV